MTRDPIDRCPLCGAWRWCGRCATPHRREAALEGVADD